MQNKKNLKQKCNLLMELNSLIIQRLSNYLQYINILRNPYVLAD